MHRGAAGKIKAREALGLGLHAVLEPEAGTLGKRAHILGPPCHDFAADIARRTHHVAFGP